jgi:hypothetical protein
VVDEEDRERIHLSLAQVAASSAAAVSAAVVCSLFGVAGTIIGTAVASMLATIGGALYSYSLRRTKARLRRLHQVGAASPPFTEVIKTARQQGRRLVDQFPYRITAAVVAAVFVIAMGAVTVIELGIGEPLATLFGVSHNHGGTTLGRAAHLGPRGSSTSKPTPTTSGSATPSPGGTPSPTPTVTVTKSVTPTTSPSTTTTPTDVLSSILSPKNKGGG